MRQYLDTLQEILVPGGIDREGRNGWTRAIWAKQLRFNLQDGFPAVTTKKLFFRSVVGELLWFLEGGTRNGRADNNRLKEIMGSDQTIWSKNAAADYWIDKAQFPGDLGRIYGVQWRSWRDPHGNEIDQVANAINKIFHDPYNRRILVTALNPGEIDDMALPPCHLFFHFFVADGRLSMHMVQRSCDMFLGVPFNIASYALLLSMVAQVTNLEAHELVITLNDAHIYHKHYEQVKEQLTREPLPLPTLRLNPDVSDIDDFQMEDIELVDYEHHPAIKAEMIE